MKFFFFHSALIITLCLHSVTVYSQDFVNDSVGVIKNKGTIRFLADTGRFANGQRDINKIDNSNGIVEFLGRNNRFTNLDLTPSNQLNIQASTALGVRCDFRLNGLTRYASAADTQRIHNRYYSNLQLDNVAFKVMPDSVFIGTSYTVVPNTGSRKYNGFFYYDGILNQSIFPENGSTPLLNRYFNLGLLVSCADQSSTKTVDSGKTIRIDGIVKSTQFAPLDIRSSFLGLGNIGNDSSEFLGSVTIRSNGIFKMGEKPAVFYNTITADRGSIQALQFAGHMRIAPSGLMQLASTQGKLEMASDTKLFIEGDFRNQGNGSNFVVNDNSLQYYRGGAGQEIEFTTNQNPYGNLTTLNAKTARDNFFVGGNLLVQDGNITMNTDTLTMISSAKTVVYKNGLEEVIGKFRHLDVQASQSSLVFNNAQTTARFISEAQTRPRSVTMEVRPAVNPEQYEDTTDANRKIILNYAGGGSTWEAVIRAGYRKDEVTLVGAENELEFYETDVLNAKNINTTIVNPSNVYTRNLAQNSSLGWVELPGIRPSTVSGVPNSVTFESGKTLLLRYLPASINPQFFMTAKVFLEGAWREGEGMDNALTQLDLTPTVAPDMYPYQLDPLRTTRVVTAVPDSIVDWVTVELRSELTGGTTFARVCLLRKDGILTDVDGVSPVLLPINKKDDYYVVVHHRNHLAVMTQEKVKFESKQSGLIDLTSPSIVLGGANALKTIDGNNNSNYIYGMIAGDNNGDGIIDASDYTTIWNNRDIEGYFNEDTDLQGIVTTRDFNVSWNNRDKKTAVPKKP